MTQPTSSWQIVDTVLSEARTIAVLGAHVRPDKPAFYVPDYMAAQGYAMLPVNPAFAGQELWGVRFSPTLGELSTEVDVINVFRRSEALADHLDDFLAVSPRPRWVWFQLGVRNDSVAGELEAAGITVIQDRCLLADHRRWSRHR